MRHHPRDATAARRRAALDQDVREWHPVLAAVEVEPGVWHMTSPSGSRYGIILALEIGGERGYRAVTGAEASEERRLIGYFRTLRAAAMRTHRVWLEAHARAGGVNGS